MDKVEDVLIDRDGVFKYILIEIKDKQGAMKNIVRGYSWAEYHSDIMDRVAPRLAEFGLSYKCVGGGRIRHDPKMLTVYGYSVSYGMADHKLTVDLLKKKFPDYPDNCISFTNSGY